MWQFASEHNFTAFCMVVVLATAAASPFFFAFLAYNQTLRSRNIVARGWPPHPLDADGDIVTEATDEEPDACKASP